MIINEYFDFFKNFSDKYNLFTDGVYASSDNKYKIIKKQLRDNYENVMTTPARVNRITGEIEINSIYKKNKSVLLWIIWCVFRFLLSPDSSSDFIADAETYKYLKAKDFSNEEILDIYSDMIKLAPTEHNKNRLQNLVNIFKCNS